MPADRSILVSAIVALAKSAHGDTKDNSAPWLTSELARVTAAMMGGAVTIKSLAMGGMNATGESEMRCEQLVELFTLALGEIMETNKTDVGGMLLTPRIWGIPL